MSLTVLEPLGLSPGDLVRWNGNKPYWAIVVSGPHYEELLTWPGEFDQGKEPTEKTKYVAWEVYSSNGKRRKISQRAIMFEANWSDTKRWWHAGPENIP